MQSFLSGFALGMSLIVAIGAQNAFVLKQGLKRQYVFWVCLLCAASDAALILLGVTGFAHIIQSYPHVLDIAKYFGAVFLLLYGAQHFYTALTQSQMLLASAEKPQNIWKILGICLALTWLNPHVYLDTVILLGSISTQYAATKMYFASGAMTASFVFFFSLGFGAGLLQPIFRQAKAWKILDIIIALIMWSIAFRLLLN
ncbi:amino acid transporter [Acinetobacter defluvii]|uniref:LysE/ArgO family amino acid transporter n=1 Tax=Acinetobacter defluvii TaxID=1871111 RepID=UPI00148F69EB|nr:LysE/ArgO family amino acid transporter [Acinetobacter defluvii]NNP73271.1 amino acid transporter [Acinetobacter defluvii]